MSTLLATGPDTAEWSVWTTSARLVVTDARVLAEARDLVVDVLAAVDLAASRFRPDSEVCRIAAGGSDTVTVSPLLAELVRAAVEAAEATDGAVDPTLGAALGILGYGPSDGPAWHVDVTPSWRDLRLDGRTLHLRPGTLLDLGATAKAWAGDRCATAVADRFGCGALVSLGGDIRVAGPAPAGGWTIRVQDGPGEPESMIRLSGAAAVATSSTLHRTWRRGDALMRHILDPATCRPAEQVWRTATVAAGSCLRANTLSTACLVVGSEAPALLRRADVAARLVALDGTVWRFGGWPA